MSAIEAVTAGIKDLADGTLRVSFDIEPRYAQEAYALFGSRGSSVAIAALTQQATTALAQAEVVQKAPPLTGLALLAVQWCKEPKFWQWLNGMKYGDLYIKNDKDAKNYICVICNIQSRVELNSDKSAADKFNRFIREPYMEWLKNN